MRINPLRRKPGWESRDPAERARALAQASAAEIELKLPELVRADPAPEVRRAALRRLDDLALLADRMRHDDDAGVREAARARFKDLMVEASRPEAERERVLRVEDDQDVLAHVATHAGEAPLRRLALERVTRPGTLAERCQRDPDPDIRLWLLSRIDAPATLERIADQARKNDKLVARVARERLEALKLAAGDPATLRARALAICDALDLLRRERPDDLAARRGAFDAEWSSLRPRLDDALARRVEGYFAALDPRPVVAAAPEPVSDPTPAEPVAESDAGQVITPSPEPPTAPTLHDEAALAAENARNEAAEAARERRRAERDALAEAVEALERATSEGRLAAARPAHATLAALRAATRELPRELKERVAQADEAFEKLSRWQHWSNNKVRSRICAEIDALAGSGLHPDAVAAKVKEAQSAWQKLDESESIAADAPESGIAKRFRAACHRALAPTRKYFEKRRELRGQKREAVEGVLAEVERELEANPRAAPSLRRRVVESLQRLDELDPRVRGEEGRKLRAVLARIDAMKSERAAESEAAKRKLIANLRREVARAPLDEAIEKAKHAQAEWKRLGPAAREVDDALWTELRALIDPFFEKAGAERSAQEQERNAHASEARAVLDDLAALARDPAHEAHVEARVAALTARWRALPRPARTPEPGRRDRDERGARGGRPDRGGRDERRPRDARADRRGPPQREAYDERAFDRAIDQVRAAQRESQRAVERAALAGLHEAAAICARIEAARLDGTTIDVDAETAAFDALVLPADARDAMRARLDAARVLEPADNDDALAENLESAELLAVRAEFLAGLPSPEPARERRRRFQLERLAERMRGGAAPEPRAESRAILLAWCELGPLPTDARASLSARIEAALAAIDG